MSDHAEAFIDVVRAFPDLNGKVIFVFGPDDFVSRLALRNTQENMVPLRTNLTNEDYYVLDMHENKKAHQKIASRILEEFRQTEKGRQCLYSH